MIVVGARTAALLAAGVMASACGPGSSTTPPLEGGGDLVVDSPEIVAGAIASAQTCDGGDVAPEVRWAPLPTEARSALVEMVDPDAPGGTFTHWLAFSDASAGSGTTAAGTWIEGANDFGTTGYRGPCPPKGQTHHYRLSVILLSSALSSGGHALAAGFHRSDAEAAVAARTALRQGELVATYGR